MDAAQVKLEYISVGGNRHPAAADWDRHGSGLLAFGANNNLALWNPLDSDHRGISNLLSGHSDLVNVVKFFYSSVLLESFIITGSADSTIRIWRNAVGRGYEPGAVLSEHQSSINCIDVCNHTNTFVSGAADGTVKVWRLGVDSNQVDVHLVQSISLTPKFFPLSVALSALDDTSSILAVAGTKAAIQIYVSKNDHFSLVATLSGHEGWIRSLAFTREVQNDTSDLILASASQDKYIRLWRVHLGPVLPLSSRATENPIFGFLGKSLSNKAHRFEANSKKYSITFEALLLGHEDWIYSASWRHSKEGIQLLSASADNSLTIWEADKISGIWVVIARLGEISSQKGSTSATGSTGGFWLGLWSPNGEAVVSLGRTGSWRLWEHAECVERWTQALAVTGHVKEVKGIAWAKNGEYLLSMSYDQTTRLYAEWKRADKRSWHEFSRPQIHGYDLNCIDTITGTQFISGADEKLLRVFDEPSAVADLLDRLCGIKTGDLVLPDAANIPVLGLSNKAIEALDENEQPDGGETQDRDEIDPASVTFKSILQFDHPPFEDHLARHMLWPEREKLYGHGYEISTVATSHDGALVATACRASSIDHAVIRLYETKGWREIKPPLKFHTLSVTRLQFSPDDRFLLSVGRDRQLAIFERGIENMNEYKLVHSNPKGHSRMILDGAWAPCAVGPVFATAGRDKIVKVWSLSNEGLDCKQTISASFPVTAVSFLAMVVDDIFLLAYGLENGCVAICALDVKSTQVRWAFEIEQTIRPSKSINRLSWRPQPAVQYPDGHEDGSAQTYRQYQLAVASDDTSVRLYSISKISSKWVVETIDN